MIERNSMTPADVKMITKLDDVKSLALADLFLKYGSAPDRSELLAVRERAHAVISSEDAEVRMARSKRKKRKREGQEGEAELAETQSHRAAGSGSHRVAAGLVRVQLRFALGQVCAMCIVRRGRAVRTLNYSE